MGGTAEAKGSVTKGDKARQRAELAQEQAGSVPAPITSPETADIAFAHQNCIIRHKINQQGFSIYLSFPWFPTIILNVPLLY